ncbi:MAG: hypothetical protein AAB737_01940, partial [Patescibacteria group bacterium]
KFQFYQNHSISFQIVLFPLHDYMLFRSLSLELSGLLPNFQHLLADILILFHRFRHYLPIPNLLTFVNYLGLKPEAS